MNYFERHIGDYIKDTAHLSLLEHGIYGRLMDVYYTRESGIPAAEAARLIGARSKEERTSLAAVLAEFFVLSDATYMQGRCDREIARFHDKQEKARRSAEARWSESGRNANASDRRDAKTMRTHCEGNALQSPVTSNQTPEAKNQDKEPPNPRKRGKGFAAAAIDLPEWLDRGLWQRWCKDRADRKKPITEEGARAQVAQLDKHRESGREPTAVLEHAMASGHQGLYPPAANSGARSPPPAIPQADKIAEASRLLGFAPMTIKVPEEVDA